MKQFAALFIVCLLAGCASIAAPLSETRHFSGIYINGWEAQIFVENGRESEQPYWVEMSPEARATIDAVLPDAPEPGASGRVIVAFDGRLSSRGQYGHLGVYKYIIRIENVTSAQMEHPS